MIIQKLNVIKMTLFSEAEHKKWIKENPEQAELIKKIFDKSKPKKRITIEDLIS